MIARTRNRPALASATVTVSAAALLVVALADRRAQLGLSHAELLFWIGLLGVFLPPAWLVLGSSAGRGARVASLVWLGLALYLVKVLQSPLAFTFHDEFSTLRATQSLGRTGRLFEADPLIPIHPSYPGLELVTSAVSSLAGISVFAAGVVVIGLARLALVLLLYVFFERVTESPRVGSIASLIYMTNPNFVFFDAQFAYESIALGLAVLVLVLAVRPRHEPPRPWAWLLLVPAALALAVTHHLTSFLTLAFLVFVLVVARGRSGESRALPAAAIVLFVAIAAWSGVVGTATLDYLGPVFHRAWSSSLDLLTGRHGPKTLFRSSQRSNPRWEEAVAIGSVLSILAALVLGLRMLLRRRPGPVAVALAVSVLPYPVLLALRLTQAGTEISNRSSEFLFVAIAFVVAPVVAAVLSDHASTGRHIAATAWLAALLAGGIIIGWAPWGRLPGPYLVAADARSVEPRGVAAATWARAWLPAKRRLVTDRTNGLLMGSYGLQDPVDGEVQNLFAPDLLLSTVYGPTERALVDVGKIDYVVVDRRLADSLPRIGYYVNDFEPGAFTRLRPLPVRALAKFDRLPAMSRLFDNGVIQVYGTDR